MFSVGVSDHCMVAHSFSDPFFGIAQRLHGATYAVEIEIRASALGIHNVVMDIGALREIVRRVLAGIDYSNLNEHPAFPGRTSTTERLAEYLADCVADAIADREGCAAVVQRQVVLIGWKASSTRGVAVGVVQRVVTMQR